MTKQDGVPGGLGRSGRDLWVSVVGPFELDKHEELLLLAACRTADTLDRLAVEAKESPVTVANNRGDLVAHPALVESRQQSLALARLVASLRLPTEAGGTLTRAQRRGAARGSYVRSVS